MTGDPHAGILPSETTSYVAPDGGVAPSPPVPKAKKKLTKEEAGEAVNSSLSKMSDATKTAESPEGSAYSDYKRPSLQARISDVARKQWAQHADTRYK